MNILTFDIEDWFHILDNDSTKTEQEWSRFPARIHENMDRIFSLLDELNQPATFFCLGWVAQKYPEVLRAIDERGHEIGTHSHMHQLVFEQTPQQFREDLETSIKAIEDAVGKRVKAYRAPGFSVTKEVFWVYDILPELGIEVDCSVFPAPRAHGGVPHIQTRTPFYIERNGVRIKEFPMTFHKVGGFRSVFSGGGYFRLLPYSVINNLTGRSDYMMTYFHPRDFDADQPMIEGLSKVRQFKSYYGLKEAFPKLSRLVKAHDFVDLRTADAAVDWDSVPVHAF